MVLGDLMSKYLPIVLFLPLLTIILLTRAILGATMAPAGGNDGAAATSLSIDSADVLRIILHHLTEVGLHESCGSLREESGVGAAGVQSAANIRGWVRSGSWGEVLTCLSTLDARKRGVTVS